MVIRFLICLLLITVGFFHVSGGVYAKDVSGADFVSYVIRPDVLVSKAPNRSIATLFFTNVSLSPTDLSTLVTANIEPAIIGIPLNFPNPFKLSVGTQIGYELSKSLDLQIHIYNLFGHELNVLEIDSGSEGGIGTPYYNKVDINRSTFLGKELPPGVYFYVIKYVDKILGKGKLAIKP